MGRVESILVRPAEVQDCKALLDMMRKPAVLEGYECDFRVTEKALQERLFDKEEFQVLVAVSGNQPIGMLVPAGVEHYFESAAMDFTVWVIFYSAGGDRIDFHQKL